MPIGFVALLSFIKSLRAFTTKGVIPRAGTRMDFPFGSCRLVAQVRTELLVALLAQPIPE